MFQTKVVEKIKTHILCSVTLFFSLRVTSCYNKNSRIHWDRLQNKYTNCKGIKNNTNFRQIAGIQEKTGYNM